MLLRLLVKITTFICFFSLNMQLNSTISFDINSACALSYLETSPYRCYTDLSEVLECFVKYEDHTYKYNFLPDESSNSNELDIKTYLLNSQEWPIEKNNEIPTTLWQHKLTLYIPHEASYKQGLLYVSGGYNYNKEGKQTFDKSKENLDYKKIALTNKAPVIVIEDVPNQFLFINGQPKREDQILANTYRQVMEDPMKNAYLAGHLPMAKAVVLLLCQIAQKRNRRIFIISFSSPGQTFDFEFTPDAAGLGGLVDFLEWSFSGAPTLINRFNGA